MDTSIHVIQPFVARPTQPDRRRRDGNAPAFDLNARAGESSDERRPDEGHDEHETRADASDTSTLAHEEGLGERVDVVA